jgi:hypothetical protein
MQTQNVNQIEAPIVKKAILTDTFYNGDMNNPVFKIEAKDDFTYIIPQDFADEEETHNVLLDYINYVKQKGYVVEFKK